MRSLLVFLFLLCTDLYAQTITGATSTESRCTANGSITVTASGGVPPYQYAVIAGPILKPNQSSNILTSLAAGTYTIRITDNIGVTATRSGVVVAGSYTLMSPTSVQIPPFCPGGSDGKIAVTIPVSGSGSGRAPYGFQLIAPSPVATALITPAANSYTFTGLPAGSYTYQVSDSCGNIQTRNVVLNNPAPSALLVNHINDFLFQLNVCDSVDLYSGQIFGGTPPFQLQVYLNGVISPATTLTSPKFTVATGFIMRVPYTAVMGGTHAFRLTDTCGQSYSNTFATHSVSMQNSALPTTCSIFSNFSVTTAGFKGPVTFKLYNGTGTGGALYTSFTLSNGNAASYSQMIEAVPAGTYTLEVSDACGRKTTVTNTITNKSSKSIGYSFDKTISSLDSTTTVKFSSNQYLNKPVRFTWLSGTTSFSSANNKFSGTRSYPFDTAFNVSSNVYYFSNVPMGNYRVAVTDSCGWTDTLNFTVAAANVQTMNFQDSIQPGCINANKLFAKITTTTTPAFVQLLLYRIVSPGLNSLVATANAASAVFSNTFTGLLSNTDYFVRYDLSTRPPLFGSSVSRIDTFHTPAYLPPAISSMIPVPCPGAATGSIVLNATGIAPFQYAVVSGPVTRADQPGNIFSGLPISAVPYTVRVTDACLNTNSYNFSLNPVSIPVISTSVPCATIGKPLTFTADSVNLTSYIWTGPAGVFNGRSLTIPAVAATDTGIYRLSTSTLGCTDTTSLTYHLQTCDVLPIRLTDFTGKISSFKVDLRWVTANESNMSKFIVERSVNGVSWIAIGTVPARNNTNGGNEIYFFTDNIQNTTVVFYRIKMIEATGIVYNSNIVRLSQPGKSPSVIIYPNPAKGAVTASLSGYSYTAAGVLYDAAGKQLAKAILTNGTNTIDISGVAAGVYNLVIINETGDRSSYKIIVKQ